MVCSDFIAVLRLTFARCQSFTIERFHVTSNQANFASHHTCDHHVGFLFARKVLENTTKCSVMFYLVHTTLPNCN